MQTMQRSVMTQCLPSYGMTGLCSKLSISRTLPPRTLLVPCVGGLAALLPGNITACAGNQLRRCAARDIVSG